jgi:hypothetical protein
MAAKIAFVSSVVPSPTAPKSLTEIESRNLAWTVLESCAVPVPDPAPVAVKYTPTVFVAAPMLTKLVFPFGSYYTTIVRNDEPKYPEYLLFK